MHQYKLQLTTAVVTAIVFSLITRLQFGNILEFSRCSNPESSTSPQCLRFQYSYALSAYYRGLRACPTLSNRPSPFPQNFWLIKTHKTAGSTLAGIFRQIAAHYGVYALDFGHSWDTFQKMSNPEVEEFFNVAKSHSDFIAAVNHRPYSDDVANILGGRGRGPLKYTALRHPVSRTYSHFFQDKCFHSVKDTGSCDYDTVDERWTFAKNETLHNHQYHYIKGQKEGSLEEVLAQYDFTFVTERFDECKFCFSLFCCFSINAYRLFSFQKKSKQRTNMRIFAFPTFYAALAVFILENGLQFEDVAYLASKVRKGRTAYDSADAMPNELNDYILSVNKLDVELWELANTKLDEKIEALMHNCQGNLYGTTLYLLKAIESYVQEQCLHFKDWYVENGFSEPYAYWGDSGKGPRCVQFAVRSFLRTIS